MHRFLIRSKLGPYSILSRRGTGFQARLSTRGQFHLGCSGAPSLSRPGDLCCEGGAPAVGTNQCFWRPHPQDGCHKPLPEASTGQGHTCLLTGCPRRAALRKVLPLGPLAQRFTRLGEGRAGRRVALGGRGGELSFW